MAAITTSFFLVHHRMSRFADPSAKWTGEVHALEVYAMAPHRPALSTSSIVERIDAHLTLLSKHLLQPGPMSPGDRAMATQHLRRLRAELASLQGVFHSEGTEPKGPDDEITEPIGWCTSIYAEPYHDRMKQNLDVLSMSSRDTAIAIDPAALLLLEPPEFGHIVRNLREALGLTREQLARLSNTSASTLQNIETRGDLSITTSLRSRIVRALASASRIYFCRTKPSA